MQKDALPLIDAIDEFLGARSMSPVTFGRMSMKDPHFVRDVRGGRRVWPETEEKVRSFMANHVTPAEHREAAQMILTLPFEMSARVAAVPMASIMIAGKRADAFAVIDPVHEIPVIVAHCSSCRLVGDRAVAACTTPDCPSRARRAA